MAAVGPSFPPERSLEFETLISDVSAALLAAAPEELDAVIERALDHVRRFFDADRCGLLAVSSDRATVTIGHKALGEGIDVVPSSVNLVERFPWAAHRVLVEGLPVDVPRVADLPQEAARDRATYEAMGTRSNLSLPLFVEPESCDLITLDWVRAERASPAAHTARLRLLGEMFVNALQRRRSYEALQASRRQLDRAATGARCGLWNLDTTTGEVWATNVARHLYGFSPDAPVTWSDVLARVHPDDRDRIASLVVDATANGGSFDETYRLNGPDGQVHWVHAIGTASGRVLEGASIDVTELVETRQQAQAALEEVKRLRDRLEQENVYLRSEAESRRGAETVVGRSSAIRHALELAAQVAPTDSTVLLLGETGTGKERFATYIHERSRRRTRTMIRVNCSAIPVALIESELFGREKGAFTGSASRQLGRFELAHGSTLFLDEVGDLPSEVQVKLLRVLEEGTIERLGNPKPIHVDVRIIAATHRDLAHAIASGTFRADLFYRLNVFPLPVPPLRERLEDIPLLVEAFVEELAATIGKRIRGVDRSSFDVLAGHSWPGNVRELRNVIERAMILSTSSELRIDGSLFGVSPLLMAEQPPGGDHRSRLLDVLQETGWRIRGEHGAAARLGIKPTTLEARLKKLGISRPGLVAFASWAVEVLADASSLAS